MAVNSDTITGEAFSIIFKEMSILMSYKPTREEKQKAFKFSLWNQNNSKTQDKD